MLILNRKIGESIYIGNDTFTVTGYENNTAHFSMVSDGFESKSCLGRDQSMNLKPDVKLTILSKSCPEKIRLGFEADRDIVINRVELVA